MTKQEIIAEIVANIKTNGKKEISGKTLQYVLLLLTQNTFNVDEEIPIAAIQSLQAALDLKQDKDAVVKGNNVALWDTNQNYSKALNNYCSYRNINSSEEEFHQESIYRCSQDTLAGESPETHPKKWIRQSSDTSSLLRSLNTEVKERKDDVDELIALIEAEANSRIAAEALKIDLSQKGNPNGVASLDQSGLIPATQLPQSVLERLTIVPDQPARYALSIDQVQNGDTVKQADTGEMWYVKDQTNLNNENGYAVYTAGTASSVPWAGITNKADASATVKGLSKLSVAPLAEPIAVGDNDSRLQNIEYTSNKVTSFLNPTDIQYPSAKLVSDTLSALQLGQAVTVGIGGQYSKPSLAIAAGFYNLIQVGDFTEDTDITIPTGVQLIFKNKNKKYIGTFSSHIYQTGTQAIAIFQNVNFIYNVTTSPTIYGFLLIGHIMYNCIVENKSTVSGAYITNGGGGPYYDCKFIFPNSRNNGFSGQNSTGNLSFYNCIFQGGGTSCDQPIGGDNTGFLIMRNCYLTGIWASGTLFCYTQLDIDGLYNTTPTSVKVFSNSDFSKGCSSIKKTSKNISINGTNNIYDNIASLTYGGFGSSGSKISNSVILLENPTISYDNIKLNNITVGTSNDSRIVTLSGSQIDLKSSAIYGSVIISGNKNIVSSCFFGQSGSITKTVTLNIGASNCIIENCIFEIAPIDNSGNNTNTFRNNRLWDGTLLPDKIPNTVIHQGALQAALAPINSNDVVRLLDIKNLTLASPTLVGVGGDYPSLALAFLAGKYNIKLVSNISEVSNPDILTLNSFYLDLNLYTLNLGSNKITSSNDPRGIYYIKNGNIVGSNLLLDINEARLVLDFCAINISGALVGGNNRNVTIQNQSIWQLPNISQNIAVCMKDSQLVGGGSSCNIVFYFMDKCYVNGVFGGITTSNLIHTYINITGDVTISGTVGMRYISYIGGGDSIGNNVICTRFLITGCNVIGGSYTFSTWNYGMYNAPFKAIGTLFSDSISFDSSGSYGQFTDGSILKDCTIGASGDNKTLNLHHNTSKIEIDNCTIYGVIILDGKNHKITNSNLGAITSTIRTATANSGTSNCTIENCVFEAVPINNSGNNTNTFRNNRLWDGTLLPDTIPNSVIHQGVLQAALAPVNPTDVVRKSDLDAALSTYKYKEFQFYSSGETTFQFFLKTARILKNVNVSNLASITIDGNAITPIDGSSISYPLSSGFHTLNVIYSPNAENMAINLYTE